MGPRRPYYHVFHLLGLYWFERDYDGVREREMEYESSEVLAAEEEEERRIGRDPFPYPGRGRLRSNPLGDSSLSRVEKTL